MNNNTNYKTECKKSGFMGVDGLFAAPTTGTGVITNFVANAILANTIVESLGLGKKQAKKTKKEAYNDAVLSSSYELILEYFYSDEDYEKDYKLVFKDKKERDIKNIQGLQYLDKYEHNSILYLPRLKGLQYGIISYNTIIKGYAEERVCDFTKTNYFYLVFNDKSLYMQYCVDLEDLYINFFKINSWNKEINEIKMRLKNFYKYDNSNESWIEIDFKKDSDFYINFFGHYRKKDF